VINKIEIVAAISILNDEQITIIFARSEEKLSQFWVGIG